MQIWGQKYVFLMCTCVHVYFVSHCLFHFLFWWEHQPTSQKEELNVTQTRTPDSFFKILIVTTSGEGLTCQCMKMWAWMCPLCRQPWSPGIQLQYPAKTIRKDRCRQNPDNIQFPPSTQPGSPLPFLDMGTNKTDFELELVWTDFLLCICREYWLLQRT